MSVPPAMLPSIPQRFSPIELNSSAPTPQAFSDFDPPPPTPVLSVSSSTDLVLPTALPCNSTFVPPATLPSTIPAFPPSELNSPMPLRGSQASYSVAPDSPPPTPALPALLTTDMPLSTPHSLPVASSSSVTLETSSPITCIDPSLLEMTTPAQATTSTLTRNQGHHVCNSRNISSS